MNPELVFYNGAKLLEAVYYDKPTQILYFTAIRYNTIFAFNTKTLAVTSYMTDGPVGNAIIDKDGNIYEAEKCGIYTINPKTFEKKFVAHINPNPKMRYNHGMFDSRGRFLVDIMGDEDRSEGKGGLYSFENGKSACLVYGTTVANGMGFSSDEKVLYFTDTVTKKVMAYDYDIETGKASNERIAVELGENDGKPDGVFVDIDDMLWVTEWDGGKLCKWDPYTHEKLEEIKMPCAHITSCCRGGENLEYIYIATAKKSPDEPAPAGGLFRIKI